VTNNYLRVGLSHLIFFDDGDLNQVEAAWRSARLLRGPNLRTIAVWRMLARGIDASVVVICPSALDVMSLANGSAEKPKKVAAGKVLG
jgi:hypothetical protein